MTFYNEIDPRAAAWLRELRENGAITDGHVSERSITDLETADLDGYDRAHFFAGIGGWDLALQLAGWPDDVRVWTGSCPCQPFSCAGKRRAQADERHLWPAWFRLIQERHPECILGEQVASAIGHGWLDGIFADLEGEGYTCGATVLGAHSVDAPHIRQRLYWVAYASGTEFQGRSERAWAHGGLLHAPDRCATGGLGNAARHEQWRDSMSGTYGTREPAGGSSGACWPVNADNPGRGEQCGAVANAATYRSAQRPGTWSDCRIIPCADGKARRIESGIQPLAYGIPGRVGLLRGYGNAIVPQVAAAFVAEFMGFFQPTNREEN